MTDRRGLGRILGLVPLSLALYPTLSAAQNVWHSRRCRDSREMTRAIRARECWKSRSRRPGRRPMHAFSSGMKRLLISLVELFIGSGVLLDEPTVGVDPASREKILTQIRRYGGYRFAVIYSTHYMDEAERICDRVLLIDAAN